MKLWKEENQVHQARPASDVIAKNLRGLAPPAPPWLLRHCTWELAGKKETERPSDDNIMSIIPRLLHEVTLYL